MRDLFIFVEISKLKYIFGIALMTLGMLFSVAMYYEIYVLISQIVPSIFGKDAVFALTKSAVLLMILFMGLNIALNYVASFLCHSFAFDFITNLRKKLIHKLKLTDLSFFATKPSGETKEVLERNIMSLEPFFAHNLPNIIATFIYFIALNLMLFYVNWILALCALIPLVIAIFAQIRSFSAINSGGLIERYINSLTQISTKTGEFVRSMPAIKIYGSGIDTINGYKSAITSYSKLVISMAEKITPFYSKFRIFATAPPLFIITGAVIFFGENISQTHNFATLIFFLFISTQMAQPIFAFSFLAEQMETLGAFTTKLKEITSQKENFCKFDLNFAKISSIKVENLSFFYGQKRILNSLNLSFKKGEITAIVGASGCGKSTLLKILMGFLHQNSGNIYANGKILQNSSDLAQITALVSQENQLFSATIAQNIAFFKPNSTIDEIKNAANLAGCEFIKNLPNGFETVINSENLALSGGQIQRICIARSLLKGAEILLFDEVTSALDPLNEEAIFENLNNLKADKIIIFVAHRIASIKNANNIVVMDNGNVESIGNHESLSKNSALYQRLWNDLNFSENWALKG